MTEDLEHKLALAIIQSHPYPTIVVDKELRILTYNEEHMRQHKKVPRIGDIMYKDYASHHEIDMYAEAVDAIRRGVDKTFSERKYDDGTGNGTSKILSIKIHPYEYGAIITCKDITREKEVERELSHARSLKFLANFAKGIGHDMNNILGAMTGNISLMYLVLKEIETETVDKQSHIENARELLGNYGVAGKRGIELIRKLMNFAKGDSPIKEEVTLQEITDDLDKIVCNNGCSKSKITCYAPQDVFTFEADRTQMFQVMENLVCNAHQAMQNGGEIFIHAENIPNGESYARNVLSKNGVFHVPNLSRLDNKKYVKISVTDSGVGIPKENYYKLFHPGFTTKKEGHGIGLMGSYLIVRGHKGHITIESSTEQNNSGTTFSIYLPAK